MHGENCTEQYLVNNSRMRNAVLVLWLAFMPLLLPAQVKWEAGTVLAGTGYLGDLNPHSYPLPEEVQAAWGAFARFLPSPVWAFRTMVWQGKISGSDNYSPQGSLLNERGYSFSARMGAINLIAEWDPFGRKRYPESVFRYRARTTPYVLAGFGMAYVQTDTDYRLNGEQRIPVPVKKDLAKGQKLLMPSSAFGGGIKLDLSKTTTLTPEVMVHYQRSDYLDGISYSGNPDARDWVVTAGLSLTFRFSPRDSDGDSFPDKIDACPRQAGVASAKGCPDQDGDGVEDAEDACPDQAGLLEFSGCPDSDGDGFMDKADKCPFAFGFEDTDGCPDRDNDCVMDTLDLCPDEEGLAVFQGCPDVDGDSIPDYLDPCPKEAGLIEHGGCPLPDSDCDGVLDRDDLCPHTADTTNFTGCPDTDGDGIIDPDDCCPAQAGIANLMGCPELKKEEKRILERAMREVRFKTGSAILLPASKKVLDEIVVLVNRYPAFSLDIRGHTDSQGKASFNQVLSEKRAKSCFDYLAAKGVPPTRITHRGFGESKPIADNRTEKGRLLNRRVEFELLMVVVEGNMPDTDKK